MTPTGNNDDDTVSTSSTKSSSGGLDAVRSHASDAAETAIAHAKDGLDQARGAVSDAYASSRERASDAYAAAVEKAKHAGQRASESIETNPIAVLLGGLAIGAAIGALIRRSEREAKLIGGVSDKLNGIAKEALLAARGAGQEKLDELGLTREKAQETVKSLLDSALVAATTAGSAAIDSAKQNKGAA